MARNKEGSFQDDYLCSIREDLPGIVILKNDAHYILDIPDFTLLYGDTWAWLEFKSAEDARHQPNQDYYIGLGMDMSYAAFVYPENAEEVRNELYKALRHRR